MNYEPSRPLVVFLLQKNICKTLPQAACSVLYQKFISYSAMLVYILVSGPHPGPTIQL